MYYMLLGKVWTYTVVSVCLSQVVIEFCEECPEGTYEDLLNRIQTTVPPQLIGVTFFTEDSLLRHAQFIVEQVVIS